MAPANAKGFARRAGPGPIPGVPKILGAARCRISGIPNNSPTLSDGGGASSPIAYRKVIDGASPTGETIRTSQMLEYREAEILLVMCLSLRHARIE